MTLEGTVSRNPTGISVGKLEWEGPEATGVSLSRFSDTSAFKLLVHWAQGSSLDCSSHSYTISS